MTLNMSMISKKVIGQGNAMEDSNPIPIAFRQTPEPAVGAAVPPTVVQPLAHKPV